MIVTKDTQAQAVDLSAFPAVIPNSIAGTDAPAADDRTFAKLDPATGQEICRVARSSAADVARAVDVAKRAQPGWAALTPVKRGDILRQVALLMREQREAIAGLVAIATLLSWRWLDGSTAAGVPSPLPSIVVGRLEGAVVTP